MNPGRLLSIAVLLLIAGCGRPEEVPHTPPTPAKNVHSADCGDPPGVIVYCTGEPIAWPLISLPMMEISFDLPEVPEHVLGPFSEDILPAKE